MTDDRTSNKANLRRPLGIVIMAILMMAIGSLTGVFCLFAKELFGIATNGLGSLKVFAATVGVCYVIAGWNLLKMKRWSAIVAISLIVIDVTWHILMMVKVGYGKGNILHAVTGPFIALLLAVYIASRWKFYE